LAVARSSDSWMPVIHGFTGGQNGEDETESRRSKKYSHMNFIADIVEQASPGVVFIESQGRHPFFPNQLIALSSGSGFLVDKHRGVILTNAHVVANNKTISVKLKNGKVLLGQVEFVDERIDLATVRISPTEI